MPYSFDESLKKGKEGEARILAWMKHDKQIDTVIDLRDDDEMRRQDIDFRIFLHDGRRLTVELKTDGSVYRNLYFEEMSAVETGSIGCLAKTKADCILYFYSITGVIYRLNTIQFRQWVSEHRDEIIKRTGLKQIKNWSYMGGTYTSTGLAIPQAMIDADLESANLGVKVHL